MIPSVASLTPSHLATFNDDSIVPLAQRAYSAPASSPAIADKFGLSFDSDPLARAFLDALRALPPTDDARSYADAVSQLMREFADPQTGKPAFVTLEQQSEILQRAMEQLTEDDPLKEPLLATLIGTINLQSEMTKWMQNICMSDGTPPEFEEW